ncbi:chaperone NapD [Flagellimonas pacifica]|uniref:Periplasmic nitrate reductase chaperone NapD n=1 Tax=Flagellimonas pacifica TaxID=1247520 RepID=A0A285MTU9_9FLAO|nr:chaperone NapD [Allomuricauda parva]SNY99967.1 periplasmic nitrate reductase chaperone NapD [Allomuricauda parva]
MPIKSYLVHPSEGKKDQLAQKLSNMEHCEVLPAENEEVLILVTETNSKQEEEILKENLEQISDIKLMAMVSGFDTPKNT